MAQITFTVSDSEVARVKNTMKWLFPIPQIKNPEFVSSSQTPEIPEFIPEFTETQWIKESIRRWIVSQVKRYEELQARAAINILKDNSLVS